MESGLLPPLNGTPLYSLSFTLPLDGVPPLASCGHPRGDGVLRLPYDEDLHFHDSSIHCRISVKSIGEEGDEALAPPIHCIVDERGVL